MNQCIAPIRSGAQHSIDLAGNSTWSVHLAGQTAHLFVQTGLCWVTLEGDRNDYAVQAGETLHLRGPGLLVIQGLAEDNRVQVAVTAH